MNTAVILSARKEKDVSAPFPLIPFEGATTLLDRTVGILRENGFSHIIIVTGFRHDLFSRLAAPDVTLVYNPDYEFTASMGSLACAEKFINEDFILIEGDTFYEAEIIKQLKTKEHGNWLSITEESGSGDECYVETKNGFVTKITKDRHRVCNFEGELIGISRISVQTFKKMIAAWHQSSNPYLNYEYVLMDVTEALDRPYLHMKNIIWGDVDCQADFRRLKNFIYKTLRRKENPYDEYNLRRYIGLVFPNTDPEKVEITPMGGMSNKNFKISVEGSQYVLRVPGNGSDGMVERSNEEFNAIQGSEMGINPPIHYFDSVTGVKVADYIKDAETLNSATIQRPKNLREIADIYLRLHSSRVRLKNEFNIFREIEKYKQLLDRTHAVMYSGWEDVEKEVMELEQFLNSIGIDLKPSHNDAVPENFIKSGDGKIFLIDWEYSGMNDPVADIAALFLESEFSEESKDYFLKHYFTNGLPANLSLKLLCYQILWDYLWSIWTVVKESQGDDFGTYGTDRFNRAKSNIKLLNELRNNEK